MRACSIGTGNGRDGSLCGNCPTIFWRISALRGMRPSTRPQNRDFSPGPPSRFDFLSESGAFFPRRHQAIRQPATPLPTGAGGFFYWLAESLFAKSTSTLQGFLAPGTSVSLIPVLVTGIQPMRVCAAEGLPSAQGLGLAGSL
ncbi:hypothetical protein AGR4C_Cc100113 [Agrobacterium tumefaciens str. Kerr 14]|uniref:Uncharacterized protein n=1 Tax=Agrobacterium tumefaciens str. Kerr 14 TaxID=1183424 RepID=A0A1S7NM40_AGRTU|nr:hypothetical protein AGR4C_Cc100113 [Agrobacterium tumefaciens str. Kerr 14]